MIAFHLSADGAVRQASPPRWRQRSLLLALGAIHVLAFLMWPAARRVSSTLVDQNRISYLLPMPRLAAPSPRPPLREMPARPLAQRAPASQPITIPPAVPEPITITPAAPQPAAPADPFALAPAKPEPVDLAQRARLSAGAIDKQMRKESWNPHNKFVAHDQTALAAAIGAAHRGNDGAVTMENTVQSDGRVMTKVNGSYCAQMESNALTGGRDPFRDGVKTKVGTCSK